MECVELSDNEVEDRGADIVIIELSESDSDEEIQMFLDQKRKKELETKKFKNVRLGAEASASVPKKSTTTIQKKKTKPIKKPKTAQKRRKKRGKKVVVSGKPLIDRLNAIKVKKIHREKNATLTMEQLNSAFSLGSKSEDFKCVNTDLGLCGIVDGKRRYLDLGASETKEEFQIVRTADADSFIALSSSRLFFRKPPNLYICGDFFQRENEYNGINVGQQKACRLPQLCIFRCGPGNVMTGNLVFPSLRVDNTANYDAGMSKDEYEDVITNFVLKALEKSASLTALQRVPVDREHANATGPANEKKSKLVYMSMNWFTKFFMWLFHLSEREPRFKFKLMITGKGLKDIFSFNSLDEYLKLVKEVLDEYFDFKHAEECFVDVGLNFMPYCKSNSEVFLTALWKKEAAVKVVQQYSESEAKIFYCSLLGKR